MSTPALTPSLLPLQEHSEYRGLSAFADPSGTAARMLEQALETTTAGGGASNGGGDAVSDDGDGVLVLTATPAGGSSASTPQAPPPSGQAGAREKHRSEQLAVERMKLSQQLRSSEADLERAQRLAQARGRRLCELEEELGGLRGGQQARQAELTKLRAELEEAHVTSAAERVKRLGAEEAAAALQASVAALQAEKDSLQLEQMALHHRVAELQLCVGGGGGGGGAPAGLPSTSRCATQSCPACTGCGGRAAGCAPRSRSSTARAARPAPSRAASGQRSWGRRRTWVASAETCAARQGQSDSLRSV